MLRNKGLFVCSPAQNSLCCAKEVQHRYKIRILQVCSFFKEGMGLTDDINRGTIEPTNLKEPIPRLRTAESSSVCSGAHHTCFFLLLHTVSVCGGILHNSCRKKKPFTDIECPTSSSGNRQPEFLTPAIKSCSLHTAAGALPSGGIKRASNSQGSCSLLLFIQGAVRLN